MRDNGSAMFTDRLMFNYKGGSRSDAVAETPNTNPEKARLPNTQSMFQCCTAKLKLRGVLATGKQRTKIAQRRKIRNPRHLRSIR